MTFLHLFTTELLLKPVKVYATGPNNKGENPSNLLIAELSSSRRRASVVEVLSRLDRVSILFRITSSMSLIFLSTLRDSTPPSTGQKDKDRRRNSRWMKRWTVEHITNLQNRKYINRRACSSSGSLYSSWLWLCSCFRLLSLCTANFLLCAHQCSQICVENTHCALFCSSILGNKTWTCFETKSVQWATTPLY